MARLDASTFRTSPAVLSLLESRTEPAAVLASDGRILAANAAYGAMLGIAGGRAVGRRCYQVSHGRDHPCWEAGEGCPMHLSLESGGTHRCVHVHRTAEGEVHHDVTAQPLAGRDGLPVAFLETFVPTRIASLDPARPGMIGRSAAFNRMIEQIERVAPTDTIVLLLGETGTGKELAARALHDLSRRAARPFVPVECSGLVEALIESELFGHERGSFTGAYSRKPGLIEAAAGGTIFLDEVGDVPLAMQAKLLRFLETGTFRRVGGTDLLRADARVVAATHRDLVAMVERGEFRADLYYRLSPFPIRVPPLRERMEDLELLAAAIGRRVGCDAGHCGVDPAALAALRRHPFPGNVRELRNVIERACLLAEGGPIRLAHLPPEIAAPGAALAPAPDRVRPLEEVERDYLRWAADRFGGDRGELARALGLSERTLFRKLRDARSN
jgi:DNA-binding NtrC family response regulator